ncbi:MAG: hydrogenase formation protein HypD [Deferribacteraceae bacterium]|jgi:hydrogenase expression/formation protein HypD|nr:hydrogenase formation protein HypD [Deferribacteraceae bacterium]
MNNIFSNIDAVKHMTAAISREADPERAYRIMEVCGTHTMSIARYGIASLLPANISLVSGPGCPVCVTSQADIDNSIDLAYGAARKLDSGAVQITTFGDMLRVTGSDGRSLYNAKAERNNVHIIYSPLDTLSLAKDNPDKHYVFMAVGFETTTPMAAGLVHTAAQQGISNISVLSMCKTMPAAFDLLLADPNAKIDGFLCPGNVSIITGSSIYEPIVAAKKAAAIVGFEPMDILSGVLEIIRQINKNDYHVANTYTRAASSDGNKKAQALTNKIFEPCDARWRGLGWLKGSGMAIRYEYMDYDAISLYNLNTRREEQPTQCRCGDILRGYIAPSACPLFGKACTPMTAVGPCMVSSEGACAAYYKYRI